MAEEYFLLSESDRNTLREMLSRERSRAGNTTGRPRPPIPEDGQTPEVYVALTPSGGIPAMHDYAGTGGVDIPGSAECAIFRRDPSTGELIGVGITRVVYNLSATAIDGVAWIHAVRDKWGQWYAQNPNQGGGSSTLLVRDSDTTVSVSGTDTISFAGSGVVVTQAATGSALVTIAGAAGSHTPTTSIQACDGSGGFYGDANLLYSSGTYTVLVTSSGGQTAPSRLAFRRATNTATYYMGEITYGDATTTLVTERADSDSLLGNMYGRLRFYVTTSGTSTGNPIFELSGYDTGKWGFFNSRSGQQTLTGSRANTEQALKDLLFILAGHGIIVDSTTA